MRQYGKKKINITIFTQISKESSSTTEKACDRHYPGPPFILPPRVPLWDGPCSAWFHHILTFPPLQAALLQQVSTPSLLFPKGTGGNEAINTNTQVFRKIPDMGVNINCSQEALTLSKRCLPQGSWKRCYNGSCFILIFHVKN